MGKVYGCIGRKANKPFFLEKICCNIYSAEELVYCVYENAELLEKDIFTTELADWLDEECEARTLADRLYQLLSKKADVRQIAAVLLEAFPFVSSGQQSRFLELLEEGDGDNGPERSRKRGDYFLHKGRYVHALNEYENVLKNTDEEDWELQAQIYHNMGMARAGLFLLEQAAQDFRKAYELDGAEAHYYYYAAALRFSMTEGEYIRAISEDAEMSNVTLKLETAMQEASVKWQEGPGAELEAAQQKQRLSGTKQYEEWVGKTISELKEDYRRCIQ